MTESALGFTTRRYINPLYLYLYLLPDSTYLSVVGSGYMGGFQHISAVGYLGSMCFNVATLPCNQHECTTISSIAIIKLTFLF